MTRLREVNWHLCFAIGFVMLAGVTFDNLARNAVLFGWHFDRWIGYEPWLAVPLLMAMLAASYIGGNAAVDHAYRVGRQDLARELQELMETIEIDD